MACHSTAHASHTFHTDAPGSAEPASACHGPGVGLHGGLCGTGVADREAAGDCGRGEAVNMHSLVLGVVINCTLSAPALISHT